MMTEQLKSFLNQTNKARYFILYSCVFIVIVFLGNHILLTDELYFTFFSESLSYEGISEFLEMSRQIEWIIYLIIPLYILMKIFLVAVCLSIGALAFDYNSHFNRMFHAALFSEFTFIIPPVLKLFWFGFIVNDYDLMDLQYFLPMSGINFVDPAQLDNWLIYPLQLLNVFEVLYCCSLAFMLKDILNRSFGDCLAFVFSTYGVGMIFWVILVMFLTVSLS
jgi:hypothetical protein